MEGEDELVISTLLRLNESFNKDLSNLYLQIEKSIDVSQALDLAASKKLVKAPQVSLFLLSLVTTSNSNEEVFLRICHDVISDLNHQDLLGAYRIGKKINTQAPSPVVHSFSQPHSPSPSIQSLSFFSPQNSLANCAALFALVVPQGLQSSWAQVLVHLD